jgi:hypothetical protein
MIKTLVVVLVSAGFLSACNDSYKKEEQERQARIERAKELDAAALLKPITVHKPAVLEYIPPTCHHPKGWAQIGMTKEVVMHCGWGKPDRINRYTNANGTEEQWVYRTRIDGYLYFDTHGILRSMTH